MQIRISFTYLETSINSSLDSFTLFQNLLLLTNMKGRGKVTELETCSFSTSLFLLIPLTMCHSREATVARGWRTGSMATELSSLSTEVISLSLYTLSLYIYIFIDLYMYLYMSICLYVCDSQER